MKDFNTVLNDAKIAVYCYNLEEWKKVLEIIGNPRGLGDSQYEGYVSKTSSICIKDTYESGCGCYSYREWYQQNGYTVVPAVEFIAANSSKKKVGIRRKEFKAGMVYVLDNKSDSYILRCTTDANTGEYIYISDYRDSSYYKNYSDFTETALYREATPEEIYWLEQCHEAGKFLSKEQLKPRDEIIQNYSIF